jgi:hypothetical protein
MGNGVVVTTDSAALGLAGTIVILDPDEAEELGAFEEDALSVAEALLAMPEYEEG